MKEKGYPRERAVPEKRNKLILDEVRKVTYRDFAEILNSLDRELVKGSLEGERFMEYFTQDCQDDKIMKAVKGIIG